MYLIDILILSRAEGVQQWRSGVASVKVLDSRGRLNWWFGLPHCGVGQGRGFLVPWLPALVPHMSSSKQYHVGIGMVCFEQCMSMEWHSDAAEPVPQICLADLAHSCLINAHKVCFQQLAVMRW